MVNVKTRKTRFAPTRLSLSVAAAVAALGSVPAQAISIQTGNDDVEMRWDNTVRYTAGWRLNNPNPAFMLNPNTDETDGKFRRGDLVTNRIDLLSELDFSYQATYGFRVSAALWSENAYGDKARGNPAFAYSNLSSGTGNYSTIGKRYATGSSGEFLDAFVFGRFALGETQLGVKAGQHNQYWGESLYSLGDSIAHSQGPVDTIKASSSPMAEAKELFMPLNQVSAQWQLSDTVSLNGQYLLDWKSYRQVPGGTFFALGNTTDGMYQTCAQVANSGANLGKTCAAQFLEDVTPGRNGGDYGINLKWSPTWLGDGAMGFYYRKYDEKNPWFSTQLTNRGQAGIRLVYARDTELFGWSLSKSIGAVSVGTELSYRQNTALVSVAGYMNNSQGLAATANALSVMGRAGTTSALTQDPTYEQAEGARGNTFHALVNAIYLLPKTALWDAGTVQGEFTYQHLDKVTKNANLFYSEDYACKQGYMIQGIAAGVRNKGDGCATRDAMGLALGFTPEWPQAFPGWDLAMPSSFRYGLKGNGSAIAGPSEGAYSFAIGLRAKYQSQYEFNLTYADSHADYKTYGSSAFATPAGLSRSAYNGAPNGSGAVQSAHPWLSFSFKTSF